MEMEVSKEALKVQKELDEIHEKILDYEKKHEEKVEESLSIYELVKLEFLENGFILSQKIMTEEAYIVQNTDKFKSLINETRKLIKTLHLFVLSEISHRKYLELKFKLTSLFYSRESKNKKIKIKKDLEIQDENSTEGKEKNNFEKNIQNYLDIITEMEYLEETVNEERKTGWLSYFKEIIYFLGFISGWIYNFAGGFGKDFISILGGIIPFLLIFVVLWKYISYGIRYTIPSVKFFLILIILTPILVIAIPFLDTGEIPHFYEFQNSLITFLVTFIVFIAMSAIGILIYSTAYYTGFKVYLSEDTLKNLRKKFFKNFVSLQLYY